MTTIPNGSAAQPTTQAVIEIQPVFVEPAVAQPAAAYAELLNGPPEEEVRRMGKSKFRIKSLLSSAAIFLSLMLIVGAIFMHLKQKNHFGRMNWGKEEMEMESPTIFWNDTMTPTLESYIQEPPDAWSECLKCIAYTSTLNRSVCGENKCGTYGISKLYWQDALRLPGINVSQDYESCALDPECGSDIVRGYNEHYARDCNEDGNIECKDHIMLHILGPTGCRTQRMPFIYSKRMDACLEGSELE
ncbi:uncharacterized protein LOC132792652 [Drosophila nasuta]|uniref:uncharacterized protein LOC132792652 n=1 Tax=Drosophila nasuta TaxID=42062 RepID=UPI00295EB3A8|nr:uncharacterized protein LOC132792652 [Drosophila nasuta]